MPFETKFSFTARIAVNPMRIEGARQADVSSARRSEPRRPCKFYHARLAHGSDAAVRSTRRPASRNRLWAGNPVKAAAAIRGCRVGKGQLAVG